MSDTDTETEAFVDDSPPEDIDKAKSIGWKDPAEWKGKPPPKGFIKASEYLERASTVIPIMRSANSKLETELSEARAELKSFKESTAKTIERMSSMTKVALDRQRTQLEDKYSAAIDAATEVGDKAQVATLRKAEKADLKAFDEAADESRPDPKELEKATEKVNTALPKDVQDTIGEWIAVNKWYSIDPQMQALANAHHGKLLKEKPGMTLADNLEATRKYVASKFPEEFGEDEPADEDEKPSRGSRVEGGSRMAGGSSRSKFSQLPADAKTQADKFIKDDGLFLEKGETADKDLAKARERYAAAYLES